MGNHLHHTHIFASNIDATINFYKTFFDGKVVLDMDMAGARNVFIKIGTGRLHLYDQAPKTPGRGSIHHFGIQTDDLEKIVEKLKASGITFKKEITDLGVWRYIMVPAPDEVLVELFEVNKEKLPKQYLDYFE